MPLFGRSKRTYDEGKLHELTYVSLVMPTADLRRIAEFLTHFAEGVEAGTIRTDHMHLRDFDANWTSDHPESDVILNHPSPDPPRRVK